MAGHSDPVRGMKPAVHLLEAAECFLTEQDLQGRIQALLTSKWVELLEPTDVAGLRRLYSRQLAKMVDLRAEFGLGSRPLKALVDHLRSAGVSPRRLPEHRYLEEGERRLRAASAMAEELGEELAMKALRPKDDGE